MTSPDPRAVALHYLFDPMGVSGERRFYLASEVGNTNPDHMWKALPAAQHDALVAELDGYRAGLGRVRNEALAYMGATTPQNPIERILRLCDMASEALGIPHPPEEIA